MPAVIKIVNISKQYPGKPEKANDNITLDLLKGEILCITGENGAGKTTLMKILCGMEIADSGEIFINEKKEIINSPFKAKTLGIGMVHQHFMLFDDYTVAQNIVMADMPKRGIFYDNNKAMQITDKIIRGHGFAVHNRQKVKDLTQGEKQQVEICRVLYSNADIIILDEPTSILTEKETQGLFATLKKLVKEGKSIILITHKVNEINQIADRIAVLQNGKLVKLTTEPVAKVGYFCTGSCGFSPKGCETRIFKRSQLQNWSFATGSTNNLCDSLRGDSRSNPSSSFVPSMASETLCKTLPIIKFQNVTVRRKGQERPLLDDVSFGVKPGEILAFAGVGGNGLGVIEAVFGGFLHPAKGKVFYKTQDITHLNMRKLRNNGLSYVPADRLGIGSAKDAVLQECLIINKRHDFYKGLFFNKKKAREFCNRLINTYNIQGAKAGDKCSVLSGGNLQKLVLAREIEQLKDYLVFSQPTQGLDAASSRYVLEKISDLRKKNTAIILISSNLDEILELADRIIVMYKGKIAGEFANNAVSVRETITNTMNTGTVYEKI